MINNTKITLPEYGRHIQRLVEYCKTIPNRDKRTRYAYGIVEIMADIYPASSEMVDGKKVLWDHLAMIADYELDIDYPYPIMEKSELAAKPLPVSCDHNHIHNRMYGKVIEDMIEKACQMTDQEQRIRLFELCANQMKRSFHETNKSADEDDKKIILDLLDYTYGRFKDDIYQVFLFSKEELAENTQFNPAAVVATPAKKKKKKKK